MTPIEQYGALKVAGGRLCSQDNSTVALHGMSTHGLAWQPRYVCRECFTALRDELNCSCVRLALYTHQYHGYCTDGNKDELFSLVCRGIDEAVELGLYVIADWHILQEESPLVYADEAENFFRSLSQKYAGCPNLIYEICNEPNGCADWETIKTYARRVIPVIRESSPDAVIIVGTPEWSQRLDEALKAPLELENILYSLHFYAATHKDYLRDKAEKAIAAGAPVFISECSICDASGDGTIDYESGAAWRALIDRHGLSYIAWSLSNRDESAALVRADCDRTADWGEDELTDTGRWFRAALREDRG